MPDGHDLTIHHPLPKRWFGYTAMDWFKFYGFIAVSWFTLVFVYTKYGALFDDYASKQPSEQYSLMWFTASGLLLALPAILGFFWWASGALVKYSRWMVRDFTLWRLLLFVIILFFFIVEFDPLDRIHPKMSVKGIADTPNLTLLLSGEGFAIWRETGSLPVFKFQLGYFMLWALFWFLVFVLNLSYLATGFSQFWFFSNRVHRYGTSVLTGFRETARMASSEPFTEDYPRSRPKLPAAYRGVPLLNVDSLTEEEALRIIAADGSGAIAQAPGQPTVLFVDLGRYDHDPALGELKRADGTPLVVFEERWAMPVANREALVLPLRRPRGEVSS
ncbi:hypothetical protein KDL29_04410 [bacterium]|nr:hypothetical protein [bacterium]